MMKTTIANIAVVLILVLTVTACKFKKDHVQEATEYTCPMHPQVLQDKPGSCPICGMDLVKKNSQDGEMTITEGLKDLTKPTNSSVIAAIKTTHPERKSLIIDISASGIISHDTRRTYSIPIRFSGRIEKLYMKYNYQSVTQGQVIMDIYSPEMLTAQRELLYLSSEHKNDSQLLEPTKQKLRLLGVTVQQIESIIHSGKESFTLPIQSPFSGYIIESSLTGPPTPLSTESAGSGGMSASKIGAMNQTSQSALNSPSPTTSPQISLREGMYVTAGQSLFKVVDGNHLWAELYFHATEQIEKGDAIVLEVKGSDIKISAHVDFVQPFFSEGTQFIQARSYLVGDKNKLRVGQLITGKVSHRNSEKLWIPREAVLDLGVQQVVFLKSRDIFVPAKIKKGTVSDNWIEVIEGLDAQSEIAVNAQYLVDSESFIKVNNQ